MIGNIFTWNILQVSTLDDVPLISVSLCLRANTFSWMSLLIYTAGWWTNSASRVVLYKAASSASLGFSFSSLHNLYIYIPQLFLLFLSIPSEYLDNIASDT